MDLPTRLFLWELSFFPFKWEFFLKNLPSWADLRPFIGQAHEILTLVNIMEGSNLMPQLAKKETYLFRFFLGTYEDSIDGCSSLC